MAELKRCDLCGAEADELMSIEFPYEERWMIFFRKKSFAHYADICLDCLEKIRAERQAQIKANEVDFEIADTPQTERIKTHDYCDICNHKGCGTCIANNLDDYCVPSNYEPITQTETQNSNLTFDTPQTESQNFSEKVKGSPQTDRMTEEEIDTMLAKALVGQTDCGWK